MKIGGETYPLTFNLAEPISLVDSKDFAAVQLADVIGAAYGFARKHRQDRYSMEWMEYAPKVFGPGSIWPESERVYPQGFEAARNALVLRELVERRVSIRLIFWMGCPIS